MDTTSSPSGPTTGAATRSAVTSTLAVASCFLVADDHEAALGFYRDLLGFAVVDDVSQGGYRWLSVSPPAQPGLSVVIQSVGIHAGVSDEDRAAMDALLAKGLLGSLVLTCDDVDAVFEHVRAGGGEVLQEPQDQFYGVRDCAFRDPAGNLVRINQPLPSP